MLQAFAWIDVFVLAGGVAVGVYFHDWIMNKVLGAEAFAAKLQAKANAVKAVIK